MTVEINEEQIPEQQLKILTQTAISILKKTKQQYAYVYSRVANGLYVGYFYLDQDVFKNCFFFTDDIVRNYMNILQASPSKGL
jgi:hypothetical protein